MALPTVAECNTAAKARAADVSGDILTAAVLLPGIQSAYRKLYRKFANFGNPRIIRTVFYAVPINTSIISPATAGITDMGEPIALYERGGLTVVNVDGATPGAASLAVSTSTAHGRTTGDMVTLNQLGGIVGAEGMFSATVSDADDLIFNGLVATGTYGTGGVVGYSADRFRGPLRQLTNVLALPTDVSSQIEAAVWQGDRWYVSQASEVRQLAIDYYSSATVPTGDNDVIGVDDCIDFIAAEALSVVCATSAPQIAAAQRGEANDYLSDLVRGAVKSLQLSDQDSRSRPPFRSRGEYTSSFADSFFS